MEILIFSDFVNIAATGFIVIVLLEAIPIQVTLDNPLGPTVTTPQALIGRVINAVLGIVGSLALAMFIYGGLVWMTSAGSPEKVQKGKDVIIWAALGLIIIFASYALVNFVIFTAIKGV